MAIDGTTTTAPGTEGAVAGTPPSTPPAPTAGTQAPPTTPGQVAAPPATSTGFTYTEDRSKWIPPHRLSETTQKARDLETRLAERERQLAALTNTQIPTEDDQRAATTREAFYKMFPFMKQFEGMSEEEIQALRSVPQHIDSTKDAERRAWSRHSEQQVSVIAEQVAEALGTDNLDADQLEDVRTSFSTWLKKKVNAELETSDQQQSTTLDRYEKGDPKLLDEFSQGYTKRWVDPARRKTTAQLNNRTRPVPNSSGRTPVVSTVQRPDKFKDLDERLDFAVKLAKERGVQFGRG